MTKKKITAPLSYDPGKGRPKEYLAYLNWQEMQALQRLNGGNMERGPMGLPSFPPDWAGPGNTQTATGSWQSTGNTSVGTGSTTNGGSDSGTNVSGTTTSTSSSAPNAAAAAAYANAAAQDSTDEAVRQAAEIKAAGDVARNAALSQDVAREGIGSINIGPQQTPVKIGSGAISQAVNSAIQQSYVSSPVTQSSIASTGYYHSFADTLPATQSIGKFSTKISPSNLVNEYGNPMESWSNGYDPNKLTEGAKKIHQAIADQSLRIGAPVDYFSGKRAYNPATRTQQHALGQAIDIRINDPITGKPVGYDEIGGLAYNPIGNVAKNRSGSYIRTPEQASRIQSALAEPYREFATGVMGSFYSNPDVYGGFNNQRWGGSFEGGRYSKDYMHFDEGKVASGVSGDQARLRDEAIKLANAMAKNPSAYASYGALKNRSGLYGEADIPTTTDQTQAATNLASVENSYNPGIIPDPIAAAGVNALIRMSQGIGDFSLPSIPEAPQAQKSALAFAKKVMPESAYQAMVNKGVAEALSGVNLAEQFSTGIGALKQALGPAQTQFAGKPYQERLITTDGVTREVTPEQMAAMDPADRARIDAYQQAQRYAANQYGIADEETPVQTVNADDFVGPTYVTPEQQDLIDEQERINRYGIEGMQKIGPGGSIVSGVENLYKMFTGNDIADAATDLKNRYMQAGPAEREALRNKYPDMRRFAVSIGDIPPNAGTQYASYGSGSYQPELGNKGNQFMAYNEPVNFHDQEVQTRRAPSDGGEMSLSDLYYLWDQGIDIPSPGDPDYNDYQEYLAQKGDSAEV